MEVSFDFVLKMACAGDDLANEVVRVVMTAMAQGIDPVIFMSMSGNAFTIRAING